MPVRKRPNPAVEASEARARAAEGLAENAERENRGPGRGQSVAEGTRALAQRRRTTADKIRKERPYLISSE